MNTERARLLQAPAWPAELAPIEASGLAELVQWARAGLAQAYANMPAASHGYLHDADKHLALAASSLAIAGLVETEEAPR